MTQILAQKYTPENNGEGLKAEKDPPFLTKLRTFSVPIPFARNQMIRRLLLMKIRRQFGPAKT